jgi:hypothetical protein
MSDEGKSPALSPDGKTTGTFKETNALASDVSVARKHAIAGEHKNTAFIPPNPQSANDNVKAPPVKQEKKKRTRAKKPKDMPRRPLSAYNLCEYELFLSNVCKNNSVDDITKLIDRTFFSFSISKK